MFHGRTLTSVEPIYSTKWHNLKKRFRFLFNDSSHQRSKNNCPSSQQQPYCDHTISFIEDWYNCVAPQQHQEGLRRVCKSILKFHQQNTAFVAADKDNGHEYFKAQSLLSLYGVLFAEAVHGSVLGWLQEQLLKERRQKSLQQSNSRIEHDDLIETFRTVFTSIMQKIPRVSVTRATYRSARKEATPLGRTQEHNGIIDRRNFHQKIDWNDIDAKDRLMRAIGEGRSARHNKASDCIVGSVAGGSISMPGKQYMKGMKIPNNPLQHYLCSPIRPDTESDVKNNEKMIVGSSIIVRAGSRFDSDATQRFQQNKETAAGLGIPTSFTPGEHHVTIKDLRGRQRCFTISHQVPRRKYGDQNDSSSNEGPDEVKSKPQAAAHAATAEFYGSNNWKSTTQALMCNHPAGGGFISVKQNTAADSCGKHLIDTNKRDVVSLVLNPKMEPKEHPSYTAVTASVGPCVPNKTLLKPLLK